MAGAVRRDRDVLASFPDAIDALLRRHGIQRPRKLTDSIEHLAVERALATRYLTLILQRDLAYGDRRLALADAQHAAALFVGAFGTAARFYPNIGLSEALLDTRERGKGYAMSVRSGIFGTTLEEGVYAFDPAGLVGALFIGDED